MRLHPSTAPGHTGRRAPALAAAVLALALAGCSGDGPSWFNFPAQGESDSSPVRESRSGTWLKDGVEQRQRDRDIQQCREVAAAQVRRDRQVDQDRQVGQSTLGTSDGTRDLRTSLDSYSLEQRQARLFARCMRSKGYQKR